MKVKKKDMTVDRKIHHSTLTSVNSTLRSLYKENASYFCLGEDAPTPLFGKYKGIGGKCDWNGDKEKWCFVSKDYQGCGRIFVSKTKLSLDHFAPGTPQVYHTACQCSDRDGERVEKATWPIKLHIDSE